MAVDLNQRPSSLFAKLITIVLVLACLGAAFWAGSLALQPIEVPPPPPPRTQVRFDSRVDVSKNNLFMRLDPLGPAAVEAGALGKTNPFSPTEVEPTNAATTTRLQEAASGPEPGAEPAAVNPLTSVESVTTTAPTAFDEL